MVQTQPLKDTCVYKVMMRAILLLSLLASSALCVPETIKEGNLYKLYGVNFEKFLKANPTTLVVIHDASQFSTQVIETLDNLQPVLALQGFKNLRIAKMEDRSASRWVHMWRAHDKPFLRLYVGDGIFTDFKYFPSSENIFEWVNAALTADTTLVQIDSEAVKRQFLAETRAFYMRFPADQSDQYLSLLRNFKRVDPTLPIYYTTDRLLDAFDKFRPTEVVVGFQRKFDDGVKAMAHEKSVSVAVLQPFFDIYRVPDVHTADEALIREALGKKRKTVLLFDQSTEDDAYASFKGAAFQNKEKFMFVFADVNTATGRQLLNILGVEDRDLPAIRIVYYPANEFRTFNVAVGEEEQISSQLDDFLKHTTHEISANEGEESKAEVDDVKEVITPNSDL